MTKYVRIDNKIYQETVIRREVDLDSLKRELADLKAMGEPRDEELIEHGKMNHPYYTDREMRIPNLEKRISEVETSIKEK